jgi:signal transduction histidine kinase
MILSISDNGLGIDLVRNKDKIFGMYKTFHGNKDAKGLGLFISKNQVEAIGGTLEVESEPNIGTTFKIHII